MENGLRSCMWVGGWVVGYVWYLGLYLQPRHVAQQMRYQNVGLWNGHCLTPLELSYFSHVTYSAHAQYISGNIFNTFGPIGLKLAAWGLFEVRNGVFKTKSREPFCACAVDILLYLGLLGRMP